MKNLRRFGRVSCIGSLLLTLLSVCFPSSARANVYATSIRVNDSKPDISSPQGTAVKISYILNEAASAGAEVYILSGTNVLRTIKIASGQPGTLRGRNMVSWDGKGDTGTLLAEGSYSLQVRAASVGFSDWTPISDDAGATNYVYLGTGIAVNQNPSSPYYGQVYVANSDSGPNAGVPGAKPGENNGLLRFNADGSAPEEGILVTNPLWTGGGLSPWHVEVTEDDFVYVNDMATFGEIYRWTADLSSTSRVQVLSAANFPDPNDSLYGPAVFGSGTNRSVWVGDFSPTASLGILKYSVTTNGTVATTNTGMLVVGITNDPTLLSQSPSDVALDLAGNIYTIQSRTAAGDLSPRVLRFPAYDPSTNGNTPEFLAYWFVGTEDDTMGRASGLALDPTGTYLAVAFKGIDGPSLDWINGCTQIFYASNGLPVTNLDLGLPVNGESSHQDSDCAWDAVGNVYFIDDFVQLWRTFSPPGPNQSTTVGLQHIEITPGVTNSELPLIQDIAYTNGVVTIRFDATAGTPASSFKVAGADTASGPYLEIAGAAVVNGPVAGHYIATVPTSGSAKAFYRILAAGGGGTSGAPIITSLTNDGVTVRILFSGTASDTPGSFVLLSTPSLFGTFAPAAGATITKGATSGTFVATVPANGPKQFYKIQK